MSVRVGDGQTEPDTETDTETGKGRGQRQTDRQTVRDVLGRKREGKGGTDLVEGSTPCGELCRHVGLACLQVFLSAVDIISAIV